MTGDQFVSVGVQLTMATVTSVGRCIPVIAVLFAIGCASVDDNPNIPSPGRQAVLAPIDNLDVRVLESSPPQYVVAVKAGLPSGCAERNRHEMSRTGETITVTVLNWMPGGSPACTAIYGSYDVTVTLGSDFRSGTTYTVKVNDKQTTFIAQ